MENNRIEVNIQANAKINLMLDILGKRENGYHDLFMVMQTVSLYDEVSVCKDKQIKVLCDVSEIPADKSNTAYKAAEGFFEYTGITGGACVKIKKKIPFAAGLAGGSADAAAVIKGLNELYATDLTAQQMCQIGVKVGADVPFCIMGGTRICTGIGEKMELIRPLKSCYILLAKPNFGVSTAQAYAEFDKHGYRRKPDKKGIVRAIKLGDLKETARLCENVFEQFIDVPQRAEIKSIMRRNGAVGSCMSGSGPTVFGIFESVEGARKSQEEISRFCDEVFITTPVWRACLTDSER